MQKNATGNGHSVLKACLIATCVFPFFVAISAIMPEVLEYHVPRTKIETRWVQDWWFGYKESEERRSMVLEANLGVLGEITGESAVLAAEKLRMNRLVVPGFPDQSMGLPESVADLKKGPPTLQLKIAALVVADIYLEAYRHSNNRLYLESALIETERFIEMERNIFLPVGFVWNDHAIAARVLFLTRLIDAVMRAEIAELERVATLFESLSESVHRLGKPSQYTYRTNHGVIQNLAVLHVAAFCDDLPGLARTVNAVIDRQQRHLKYYVTDDGIVKEHSSSYQDFGLMLFYWSIRYYELLGLDIPSDWMSKYRSAQNFLTNITRSDGTVPRYGDSNGNLRYANIGDQDDRQLLFFSEEYGYWSSWSFDHSHLFIPWANFVSGAHKHDDEMAVFFWSRGQEWWTASGYWPYGHPMRSEAIGWLGSNAPHVVGETTSASRQTRVVAWANHDEIQVLHLQRIVDKALSIHRIIVATKGGAWFVFDGAVGTSSANMQSTWMTMSGVQISQTSDAGDYRLSSLANSDHLDVSVRGGDGASFELENVNSGSMPGWLALNGRIVPTNVLRVEIKPGSWSLLAWRNGSNGLGEFVENVNWSSTEEWELSFLVDGQVVDITCADQTVVYSVGHDQAKSIALTAGMPERFRYEESEADYRSMSADFKRYRDLLPWRMKAMFALLAASVIHVLFLALFWRLLPRCLLVWAMGGSAACWGSMAVWMHAVYLT